jgi:hypothetical protein
VVKSAMTKLAKNGKGILLMHDFQHTTAEAMPELMRQLKAGDCAHGAERAGDDAGRVRRYGPSTGQVLDQQQRTVRIEHHQDHQRVKEAQRKRSGLMPRAFYRQLQSQSRPNAPKFEPWLCPKSAG